MVYICPNPHGPNSSLQRAVGAFLLWCDERFHFYDSSDCIFPASTWEQLASALKSSNMSSSHQERPGIDKELSGEHVEEVTTKTNDAQYNVSDKEQSHLRRHVSLFLLKLSCFWMPADILCFKVRSSHDADCLHSIRLVLPRPRKHWQRQNCWRRRRPWLK